MNARGVFGWLFGLIFAAALVAGLAATLGSSGLGLCIGDSEFCANSEHLRWYLAIAAVAGILALLLLKREEAGPLSGAAVVLLGVVGVFAVSGGANLKPGEAAADSDKSSLKARLERTVSRDFVKIELDNDSLSYPTEEGDEGLVRLVNDGLAAVRFTLHRDARLRIDIEIVTTGNPFLEIYREEGSGRKRIRTLIASNANSGKGVNSRIERDFDAADYLLVIRNISAAGGLQSSLSFGLKITEKKLDDLVGPGRALTLTLGANSQTCQEPISDCHIREDKVFKGGSATTEDLYLLKLDRGDQPACLHVAVTPKEETADLILAILVDGKVIHSANKNKKGGGERLDAPVDDEALLLLVGGFSDGAPYELRMELKPKPEGGDCASQ